MLIKNYIFWPKNAKTGNITLGEILIRKNWCGRFWWFWIFNSTFWLAWQAIIFSTSMLFRLSLAFSVLISINKQIMHMNTKYKIVLHENGDHLAFSKNMNHDVLCSKQRNAKKAYIWKSMTSPWKFFYMLICECKSLSNIFLDIKIRKLLSKHFCGWPSNMIIKRRKNTFIANTIDSGFNLTLKWRF